MRAGGPAHLHGPLPAGALDATACCKRRRDVESTVREQRMHGSMRAYRSRKPAIAMSRSLDVVIASLGRAERRAYVRSRCATVVEADWNHSRRHRRPHPKIAPFGNKNGAAKGGARLTVAKPAERSNRPGGPGSLARVAAGGLFFSIATRCRSNEVPRRAIYASHRRRAPRVFE